MGQFQVFNSFPGEFTFVSNRFLDLYMPSANGEFVKIYLYLLRHCREEQTVLELSSIADTFDCREADVIRAMKYWKKAGILDVSFDPSGALTGVVFYPLPFKAETALESAAAKEKKPVPDLKLSLSKKTEPSVSLSRNKLQELKGHDEVRQLLFIAEQYLGRTLTSTDMETLLYLYDEAGLSGELMEYLIEYCVSKGSSSMAYIKKVGLAWAQQKITTVTQAKEETDLYNKNYFTILRAFGIKNRNPLDKEIQYMNLWLDQYGFTLDIIQEACSRTVLSTGKASFSYADSILESWFKKGVHHLSDVKDLDQSFQQKKIQKASPSAKTAPSRNKFNNFHQRAYNMAELEKQLLGK